MGVGSGGVSAAPSLSKCTSLVLLGSPLSGSKVITSVPLRLAWLKSPPKISPLLLTSPVNVPHSMMLLLPSSFLLLITLPENLVPPLPVIVPEGYLSPFITLPAISPPLANRTFALYTPPPLPLAVQSSSMMPPIIVNVPKL